MTNKEKCAFEIVKWLSYDHSVGRPTTADERIEILHEVGKSICLLCGDVLDGRKCYCAPGYDE